MADKIDEFIATFDGEKGEVISRLRNLASDISKGAREDIKWNALCLFKSERAFVGIMPYKKYVSVIFDRGAELPDPGKVLEGKGKKMRHIKIFGSSDTEDKNVGFYIKESYSLK